MAEKKASLKARVEAELSAASDDTAMAAMRERFAAEERSIEHEIDHSVHSFSASLEYAYNFLRRRATTHLPPQDPAELAAVCLGSK